MATRPLVEYEAHPGEEFKRILAALKIQNAKLPGKFKRRLREVSKESMTKVKAKALSLPAEGTHHSGLRKRVAKGVRLKIGKSGSTVRIITTMTDPAEAVIPRGLDTPHGWYHPVFGVGETREDMVQQEGYSWFREEIAEQRDEYQRAFTTVLEEARDMIAKSGD